MNNKTPREMRSVENQRARTSIINKRKRATGRPGFKKSGKEREKRGLVNKQ